MSDENDGTLIPFPTKGPPQGKANLGKTPANTAAAALALWLAGAGWDEIADALTLPSAATAQEQAYSLLAQRAWSDKDGREKARMQAGARLERLMRGVWPKATDPKNPEHLVAVKAAREIIGDLRRLYGLDAPIEVAMYTPTSAELEEWVSARLGSTSSELLAMEARVIEADVVFDGPDDVLVPDRGEDDDG